MPRNSVVAALARQIQSAPKRVRKTRKPVHTFKLALKPYQIQPFMIAPVLPGETMTNLNLQARYISDPLVGGLQQMVPWWIEHAFYYVRLRDIMADTDVQAMMLSNTKPASDGTNRDWCYHREGGINYTFMAAKAVIEEYYRDEGEAWDLSLVDGVPAAVAQKHGESWMDSFLVDSVTTDASYNNLVAPHDDAPLKGFEENYQKMRLMGVISGDMTFEEWLETWGVRVPQTETIDKPELIRYSSEWSYPTNTVDPQTGVPSTALVMSCNERADKDRFFKEPGFIVGFVTIKSKVFYLNQRASMSHYLDTAYDWMPPLLRDDPETAVKEFAGGTTDKRQPLSNQTAGYWVDMRDLYRYGDQFCNVVVGEGAPFFAMPTAGGNYRFLSTTQVNKFFASEANSYIRSDGVVRLSVLGSPTEVDDLT